MYKIFNLLLLSNKKKHVSSATPLAKNRGGRHLDSNQAVRLTPDVCVCAVHHVCGVDEVVARTLHDQLQLGEAQDQFPSDGKRKKAQRVRRGQIQEFRVERRRAYLESMPMGLKSSRCLVWKMSVLVRISRIDGGCMGVATQKSASCGGTSVPSSDMRCCPCTSFNRPRKFSACREEKQETP